MQSEAIAKTFRGSIQDGVVVLDEPADLPDGTAISVEVVDTPPPSQQRRGGQWKGRVQIADDFDELPDDLAEALGAHQP